MSRLVRALVLIWLTSSSLVAAPDITVYAGGIVGLDALATPETSGKFRQSGGGLYLHNDGWAKLTPAQQREVLAHFKNRPVGIELGFKEGAKGWAIRLQSGYLSLGIKPAFIAANAFDGNNIPTVDQWKHYSQALRATGLPASAKILPTFEYANFGPNLATLSANTVSVREDFQDLIRFAGGFVLDTPPAYAFAREENYRAWVVDAIRWTRENGFFVVWITSPHTAYESFRDDTGKFLRFLAVNDAMPSAIVCENYTHNPPENYPNVVGHEDKPNSILGVAWNLLDSVLPVMSAK